MQDVDNLQNEKCDACMVRIIDVTRDPSTHVITNRRLLAALDADQRAALASQYVNADRLPELLCPSCMNATTTTINNMVVASQSRGENGSP